MTARVETVYTKEEIDLFKEEFDDLFPYSIKRLNNLFHMIGRRPDPKHEIVVDKPVAGYKEVITNYYLDYIPDSFARFHADRPPKMTAITLIDKSDDLEGGEFIVLKAFKKKHFNERFIFDSMGSKPANAGDFIVPEIMPMEIGETCLLWGELHGVTEVTKGFRRVHVAWWA